jgi:hypothetical protein
MTEKERQARDRVLAAHVRRFRERLFAPPYPSPSLVELFGFRMGRQAVLSDPENAGRDYLHYAEHGWLESDYWYPMRLGLVKRAAGRLIDAAFGRTYRRNAEGRQALKAAAATAPGSDS